MKKFLLVLVIFCAVQLQSKAQDVPILDLGVKLGANLGSFSNLAEPRENDGTSFGMVAGAFARVNIPVIGIYAQPELTFSQTGGNAKVEQTILGQTISATEEYRQNNLDINILIGKQFKLGPLGARVNVGPSFSNVLSAKSTAAGQELDVKDNIKSFQTALQFGIGADISKINIDLRYQLGLTKIVDDANNPNDESRLNAIQLTVGYKFL